jgi:FKBP-type peptidyl-prolyl cis-trans isomerase FkpA/FKBP-type peptidyl-prolyl cis-trans isomerase FklB
MTCSLSTRWAAVLAATALGAAAQAADPAAQSVTPPAPAAAPGDFPLTAYAAFGSSLVQSGHLGELGWNEAQVGAFLEGMRAAFAGKPAPADDAARQFAVEMGRRIQAIGSGAPAPAVPAADARARLERYFKEMRRRLALQIAASGLGYNVTTSNSGVRPRPGDTVVLTVQAVAADGATKLPQLSGEHLRARLDGMMPGLKEGLQMMTVGAHAVFVIPPALSFGGGTWPEGVAPGMPLIYYVTLESAAAP